MVFEVELRGAVDLQHPAVIAGQQCGGAFGLFGGAGAGDARNDDPAFVCICDSTGEFLECRPLDIGQRGQ